MSPRRKSGLSTEDLQALKHLPAVLTALEHLQEQHAKVRALMGDQPGTFGFRPANYETLGARPMTAQEAEARGLSSGAAMQLRRGEPVQIAGPAAPSLDTPERQEFERARKEGKPVPPDPLANISEAQRERMAEQRALVEQLRAARGKSPPGLIRVPLTPTTPGADKFDQVVAEEVVREEVLPESSNGSAGAEMQSGGFIDG